MHSKILYNALITLIILIICLAILEISLRWINRKAYKPNYIQHNGYYAYTPFKHIVFNNSDKETIPIEIDEYGLRNKVHSLSKADIIVLGDSFAMAVNTRENQAICGRLNEWGLNTYNAGMDGFSTHNEYMLLKDILGVRKPKIVVLLFYLGNDFRDNYLGSNIADAQEKVSMHDIRTSLRNLLMDSMLFRFIYDYAYNGILKGYFSSVMASYSLSEMESYRTGVTGLMAKAIRKTNDTIEAMTRILKDDGIEFYIIGIPSKAQVAMNFEKITYFYLDKRSKKYAESVKMEGCSFDQPDRLLSSIAYKNGIRYVSLLNIFRKYKESDIFYDKDQHWNSNGQKVAAEYIMQSLPLKR